MKPILIIQLLFFPMLVWSQTPLKVGIPMGQDPHIYITNNQIGGQEGILLDQALRSAGFAPSYQHFPSLRAIERIQRGFIDAVINVKEESLPLTFKSSFAFKFNNCAVTKAAKKIRLEDIADFRNHEVVAFKNALTSLESERISELAKISKSYREIQDVDIRIKLLNADRADVMLTEKVVFLYYLTKYQLGHPKDYTFHCLFKPIPYHLIFRTKDHYVQFESSKK